MDGDGQARARAASGGGGGALVWGALEVYMFLRGDGESTWPALNPNRARGMAPWEVAGWLAERAISRRHMRKGEGQGCQRAAIGLL